MVEDETVKSMLEALISFNASLQRFEKSSRVMPSRLDWESMLYMTSKSSVCSASRKVVTAACASGAGMMVTMGDGRGVGVSKIPAMPFPLLDVQAEMNSSAKAI